MFLNTQAESEGWDLFEVDGRYQLQKYDDDQVFDTDLAALLHVARHALNGSQYHLDTLALIGRLCE